MTAYSDGPAQGQLDQRVSIDRDGVVRVAYTVVVGRVVRRLGTDGERWLAETMAGDRIGSANSKRDAGAVLAHVARYGHPARSPRVAQDGRRG